MVIIMVQKVRESKNQFHVSFESWGFMIVYVGVQSHKQKPH